MIYDKHNFYENFMNASGSDVQGAMEVLTGEIAELMVRDRMGILKMLADSGIRVSQTMTNGDVINEISTHLYTNPDFPEKLARLIVKNNIQYEAAGDGLSSAVADVGQGAASGGAIGEVADAIGSIANIFTQNSQSTAQIQTAQQQTQQMLIAQLMARQQQQVKKGLSTGAIIGIVLGGIGLAALIAFAVVKLKNK